MVVQTMRNEKPINNYSNLSNVLQLAVEEYGQMEGFFQSVIFFLVDEKGHIVTFQKFGVINPILLQTVFDLQEHLLNKKHPFVEKNCLIYLTKLTLENVPHWNGCIGIAVEEGNMEPYSIRSFLEGFKYSIAAIHKYGEHKRPRVASLIKNETFLSELLIEVKYDIRFSRLIKPFLSLLKQYVPNEEVEIVCYENKGEHFLSPTTATNLELFRKIQTNFIDKRKLGLMKMYPEEDLGDTFTLPSLQLEHYCGIPIWNDSKSEIQSLLVFFSKEELTSYGMQEAISVIKEITPLLNQSVETERKGIEQKRTELLLNVTKKFHSSMDVGEILEEIIFAMGEMYPTFTVHLLLSREWKVDTNLPIKQMEYGLGTKNNIAETAYLTGKIQIEDVIHEKYSLLYTPLRGKQGVYGVMEIKTRNSMIFPTHEIEFIEMLADIGGNALENAELYQQSRNLINDLQLINQTSHQLNSNLVLSETINFMTNQIMQSFGANEVGFIMFHSTGELVVMEGSTAFYFQPQAKPFLKQVSNKIKREKEALFIGDVDKEEYQINLFRSLLAVPMIQTGELKGMVLVLHQSPYHFSFENFKLLQSLIHHSTLAFTNSMLHEELEKLVITDHLTRLYARNYLDQMIQESMENDAYGCFILIDIDNFKLINDTYGHQVGDDIIIQVANIMKKSIRDNDIAARWGGEELAVYLPKIEPAISYKIAERIVKTVAMETSPKVTISCGLSFWRQTDKQKSLKVLFNEADENLYVAKKSGKNQVVMRSDLKRNH